MIGDLGDGRGILLGAEEVVVDIHRLRDLEKKVQGYGCAAQAGKGRVPGGAPVMDHDVEFDDEGGVLGC